jgi:hypothetical protein
MCKVLPTRRPEPFLASDMATYVVIRDVSFLTDSYFGEYAALGNIQYHAYALNYLVSHDLVFLRFHLRILRLRDAN